MINNNNAMKFVAYTFAYIIIITLSLSLVFQGFIGYDIYSSSRSFISDGISKDNKLDFLDLIPIAADAVTGNDVKLKGESGGRTNILLLGKDPEVGLNDSIILLSYFHETKKITTFSIPRDFYIANIDIAGTKINGVESIIERLTNQDGTEYFIEFLETEFLIDIHYFSSININGLADLVDLVGGVEVEVSCTFTDYNYPNETFTGFLSPAPTFRQGIERLDGQRAIIYARSRKSLDCDEGNDFARNRRQSEIINAVLEKINNQDLIENSLKINEYLEIINDNLETSFSPSEIFSFAKKLNQIDLDRDFISYNLTPESPYVCDTVNSIAGYIITYGDQSNCGIYIAGSGVSNIYRTNLREFIQNIDQYEEEVE